MLLASCATDIKFHKWPSGDFCGSFKIPEAGFYTPSISWCSEGEFLVTTVPLMGSPIVLSVKETTIKTHEVIDVVGEIQATTFSRIVQKKIAFGSENGRVLIYDFSNRRMVQELARLPHGVKFIDYGAQDSSLITGCKNGQICLYNSKNLVAATFYVPNANSLTGIACHSNLAHILAATSREGVVVVWDSSTGNTKFLDKSHTDIIMDVAFSSGDEMATVGLDQRFVGYDLRSKECTFCSNTEEQLSAVKYMPTGDKIAVASINGKLYCYDKRQIDHPLHTIIAHHTKAIGRIAFQNLPSCEESTSSHTIEIQQAASSKSNTTYSSYNYARNNNLIQDFTETFSQPPSTTNTLNQNSEMEWQFTSPEDYIATYLENLQPNNFVATPGRGDASNRIPVALDCLSRQQTVLRDAIPPLDAASSTSNVPVRITRLPPNNPKGDATARSHQLEEPGRNFESDAVSSWIKKLPLSSDRSDCNLNVTAEQDDDLVKLRKELTDVTTRTIEQLFEVINREFLMVRMAVSRGFVQMEYKMDARWREFQVMLGKMAEEGTAAKEALREMEENNARLQVTSSRIPTRNSSVKLNPSSLL